MELRDSTRAVATNAVSVETVHVIETRDFGVGYLYFRY